MITNSPIPELPPIYELSNEPSRPAMSQERFIQEASIAIYSSLVLVDEQRNMAGLADHTVNRVMQLLCAINREVTLQLEAQRITANRGESDANTDGEEVANE